MQLIIEALKIYTFTYETKLNLNYFYFHTFMK